jgi:hypothetical protein
VGDDPPAQEDVHDSHAHRGCAPRAAGSEPAGLGHVDPEPGGFHEPVQCRIARVRAREREWLDDRALGVAEQRLDAGEAEDRRAVATEQGRASLGEIVVGPSGRPLELVEQAAHRLRGVGDRIDALCDRLVEHAAPLVRAAREVDLVDERLGDWIGVVVAVRERVHVRVARDRVEPQQPPADVTGAPHPAPLDPLPVAEELAGNAVSIARDRGGRLGLCDAHAFAWRSVIARSSRTVRGTIPLEPRIPSATRSTSV